MLVKLIYAIRHRCPGLYRLVAGVSGLLVRIRYGGRVRAALAGSALEGTVLGLPARMRALGPDDVDALHAFLASLPPAHLKYFQPHGLDHAALGAVLARRDICCYGLFVQERIIAYALLKLFPTDKGFLGTLVDPEYTGGGIGKFLSDYICWQAGKIGVMPAATIHERNTASLRSHQAVRQVVVGESLANNGYTAYYFPPMPKDRNPPRLSLQAKK